MQDLRNTVISYQKPGVRLRGLLARAERLLFTQEPPCPRSWGRTGPRPTPPADSFRENGHISAAGAELMLFYITAYDFEPRGPLYKHCNPPNISGLRTLGEGGFGWDGTNLAGNWNLFDVEFWFQRDIQLFIDLVVASELGWCVAGP